MRDKWYHKWWVYVLIGIIFFLIGAIVFRERARDAKEEVLLIVNEDLKNQVKNLDSLYQAALAGKNKVKIIREKIDITQDIKKLQELIAELETEKLKPVKRNSTIIELKEYLEKEF